MKAEENEETFNASQHLLLVVLFTFQRKVRSKPTE